MWDPDTGVDPILNPSSNPDRNPPPEWAKAGQQRGCAAFALNEKIPKCRYELAGQ